MHIYSAHLFWQTNAAAYGEGIYFADKGSMSHTYAARGGNVSWKQSRFGDQPICLALCEIVNQPEEFTHHDGGEPGIMVVPREDLIVTRYFVVFTREGGWATLGDCRASQLDI
jgi:hypothetical protein